MKVSTTTSSLFCTFGETDGIKAAKDVGFDALDMNLAFLPYEYYNEENYEKNAERLKNCADKNGLVFNQAHAPFPTMKFRDGNPYLCNEAYNKEAREKIEHAVLFAGILGTERIVIHPVDFLGRGDQKEQNIRIFESFAEVAEKAGVKIALENMWGHGKGTKNIVPNVCSTGQQLGEYYDALDPKRFSVCLDLGHCGLIGEAAEHAVHALGHDRLHALHVHDNNGVADEHTLPYFGVMNWDNITKALADIDYDGDLTFEANGDMFIRLEKEKRLAFDAYRLMADTGRALVNKIAEYKEKA